ncbi:hypothetical protein MRB53_006540 [Persea americana]|uniref:Uncharacterized protein n=1 Tax=Persea americana TaxID=3435 RepID=A0ACC2MI21_PERAE|nr:hypothetical protein MRB53_006540 [Persea americana]
MGGPPEKLDDDIGKEKPATAATTMAEIDQTQSLVDDGRRLRRRLWRSLVFFLDHGGKWAAMWMVVMGDEGGQSGFSSFEIF